MTPERRRKRWGGSRPTSQNIVQSHRHVYAQRSSNRRGVQARLRPRVRGHRLEAPWLALPIRPLERLAQDEEPERAGGETRGGRRLGQESTKAKHKRLKGDTGPCTHPRVEEMVPGPNSSGRATLAVRKPAARGSGSIVIVT